MRLAGVDYRLELRVREKPVGNNIRVAGLSCSATLRLYLVVV